MLNYIETKRLSSSKSSCKLSDGAGPAGRFGQLGGPGYRTLDMWILGSGFSGFMISGVLLLIQCCGQEGGLVAF